MTSAEKQTKFFTQKKTQLSHTCPLNGAKEIGAKEIQSEQPS